MSNIISDNQTQKFINEDFEVSLRKGVSFE